MLATHLSNGCRWCSKVGNVAVYMYLFAATGVLRKWQVILFRSKKNIDFICKSVMYVMNEP